MTKADYAGRDIHFADRSVDLLSTKSIFVMMQFPTPGLSRQTDRTEISGALMGKARARCIIQLEVLSDV